MSILLALRGLISVIVIVFTVIYTCHISGTMCIILEYVR